MRFTDRVALITGGGRGIGAATAQLFAREGARVVVSDMDAGPAEEVARPIGGLAVACDVTSREQVEALVGRAVSEFGRLDILVCSAGIIRDNLLFKMSDEDWDLVIDTHLKGTFFSARAAQKPMVEQKYGKM
ncbi:MAG: SDR family NAD(P)-dependent oxidoreductase, partial [Chloroflexi bacterium]